MWYSIEDLSILQCILNRFLLLYVVKCLLVDLDLSASRFGNRFSKTNAQSLSTFKIFLQCGRTSYNNQGTFVLNSSVSF